MKFCLLTIADEPSCLFVVSDWLDGAKTAVRFGNTIYLSPAMWDLLIWAETEDECRRVWRAMGADMLAGGRKVLAAWETPGWDRSVVVKMAEGVPA